jgi:phosphoketolase
MVVRKDLDRFHPVSDVIDRLPQRGDEVAKARRAARQAHRSQSLYLRARRGHARGQGLTLVG